MTQETPHRRKRPQGIECSDCGHTVVVSRGPTGTLRATCGCDELRSIKVAAVLPAGWSE